MNKIGQKARVVLSILALVLLVPAQTPAPERDVVLARMAKQWGSPQLSGQEVAFDGPGYDLRAVFDEHDILTAIKGSSRGGHLKEETYEHLLGVLENIKPLGHRQKTDSRWYWGINTMTKRIDRYEHAVTDRCELGDRRSRGTGWFQVLYPHTVAGQIESVERPHAEVRTSCEGFDRKEATCVDLETPDWDLAELRIGEDDYIFKTSDYPDLKKGDNVSVSVMGPLDHVCGSL